VFLGGAVLADIIKDKEETWISKASHYRVSVSFDRFVSTHLPCYSCCQPLIEELLLNLSVSIIMARVNDGALTKQNMSSSADRYEILLWLSIFYAG
jgi:hypothetical protein